MSNQDTQGGDHGALERELAAALRERAEAIHPTDRWSEIGAATRSTQASPRRRPVIFLAAAAVTAVIAGVMAFRPDPMPSTPATPGPALSSSPAESPLSSTAAPSPSATPSLTGVWTDPLDATPPAGVPATLPVYYLATEALGWPESGLGLRRAWVPARTGTSPEEKVKAALVLAVQRPIANEGGLRPWGSMGIGAVVVGDAQISVDLFGTPNPDVTEQIAALSVQQLVFTAQAAAGKGNLPVHFVRSSGETTLWSMPINGPFTRPTRVGLSTWLTDLWITIPAVRDGSATTLPQGVGFDVSGQASVAEGNVVWEVTDAESRIVQRGVTTANVGAPDRGEFTFTIDGLPAGDYTVKAYATSPRDGQSETASDKLEITVQ